MKRDVFKNLSGFPKDHSAFSLALIRDGVLNNILGNDAEDILYYAGKEIAREFFARTLNQIQEFFNMAGWGDIKISSQKTNKELWILSGQAIKIRNLSVNNPSYSLEAGFLSQEIQQQTHHSTECIYQNRDKNKIIFTVFIN